LSRQVHAVSARAAFAGFATRVATRARRVGDVSPTLTATLRLSVATQSRQLQALDRQLATFDVGRRLASMRTRIVAADAQMRRAADRRHDRSQAALQTAVGRLESLSPLAVLGRGYAVAWSADKTRVLRDAASVNVGEVVRVTLSRGEIEAKVSGTE
jgi:exodeoxyribonuclease VII large subunit